MGELKQEVRETRNKVDKMDDKIQGLEKQIKDLKVDKEKLELRYEIKLQDLQLRVRGGWRRRKKMMFLLVELLDVKSTDIDKGLDQVYRLKTTFVRRDSIPKDINHIIVNVLSRKPKDEIMKQSLLNPIEYKGKKILVLRELPRQVIMDSKKFRKLTD